MGTRGEGAKKQSSGGNHYRVAVDVGGTFIDFVLLNERTGEVVIEKQSARAGELVEEFIAGLERLPVGIGKVKRLLHGTTVGINTVIQERGARVGLITTAGFRDVLAIGRGERPRVYDVFFRPPEPLVPRRFRREVTERTSVDGRIITPLNMASLDEEIEYLVKSGVEAIAVAFLHSYANPEHERIAAARIRERWPELFVSASSDIATEWREFERTSTAVLNAYLQPMFARYIDELTDRLRNRHFTHPLVLMQSNGGVIEGQTACSFPIRTLQSGPAGGVISVQALAKELGHENVICADVGGTTYDVALIERGAVLEANKTQVNGRPIVGPIIDMASIGAGGGSIAFIDEFGTVAVGPRSAGAEPGPACFGHGGTEPTVTDCHLVLGRLDPNNFLGSRIKLEPEAARAAIRRRVAEPARMDVEAAAAGILSVAETNMTYAIRAVTIERGLDPRDFTMYSYGGGGGLFAAAVAEELEIGLIIVPRAPANFSALGMLFADYREDVATTRVQAVRPETTEEIATRLRDIGDQASHRLRGFDFDRSAERQYSVDLRFRGQDFTLTVPVEVSWLDNPKMLVESMRKRFDSMHTQLYGHGSEDRSLEIVNCRCRAIGRVPKPRWPAWTRSEPGKPKAIREVFFRGAGGFTKTAVFERDFLATGQRILGPAIVEEWTTTTLVPPGWAIATDHIGNLELRRDRN